MKYDVFISFKNSGKDGKPTADAAAARKVYEALKANGIKVFFSEVELARSGKGHFPSVLGEALESSRVLVLVASCRENIDSPWVSDEWGAFLTDLRNGKEGNLFILNCGSLKPKDLPIWLRSMQMFPASGLGKLVEFVRNALPTPTRLKDLLRVSLHCLRPKENEDKIYLVTVHSPDGESHTVTAHYGARLSKRLVSQVKQVGLKEPISVNKEVEAMRKKKMAGGYRPVAFGKLLTKEAKWILEASLGMRSKPKSRAFDEVGSLPANSISIPPKLKAQLLEVLGRAHQRGVAAAQIIQELARANDEFSFLRSILSEFKAKASSSPLQNRHE